MLQRIASVTQKHEVLRMSSITGDVNEFLVIDFNYYTTREVI